MENSKRAGADVYLRLASLFDAHPEISHHSIWDMDMLYIFNRSYNFHIPLRDGYQEASDLRLFADICDMFA